MGKSPNIGIKVYSDGVLRSVDSVKGMVRDVQLMLGLLAELGVRLELTYPADWGPASFPLWDTASDSAKTSPAPP